jgi:two-component system OmpR family sensor kinase
MSDGESLRDPHDAARIAHDLRAPLHALLGFIDLAAADTSEPEVARLLHHARHAGSELQHLVAELSGQPDEPTAVDLHELVNGIVAMLRPVSGDHELMITGEPGSVVTVPPRAVRRIVTNLITNALRHTPPRSKVTIAIHHDKPSITIDDDGDGPDAIAVGSSSGRLGLVIVRELVERIGGSITIDAHQPHGTSVTVQLAHNGR